MVLTLAFISCVGVILLGFTFLRVSLLLVASFIKISPYVVLFDWLQRLVWSISFHCRVYFVTLSPIRILLDH